MASRQKKILLAQLDAVKEAILEVTGDIKASEDFEQLKTHVDNFTELFTDRLDAVSQEQRALRKLQKKRLKRQLQKQALRADILDVKRQRAEVQESLQHWRQEGRKGNVQVQLTKRVNSLFGSFPVIEIIGAILMKKHNIDDIEKNLLSKTNRVAPSASRAQAKQFESSRNVDSQIELARDLDSHIRSISSTTSQLSFAETILGELVK